MDEQTATQAASECSLQVEQVEKVFSLLDEGNTVSFIARYAKGSTGGLNEEQIEELRQKRADIQALNERKKTIVGRIREQNMLTDELEAKIRSATVGKVAEDVYLPYRPKRRTLATQARQKGVQALADEVMKRPPEIPDLAESAKPYVDPDKELKDLEDVLVGVRHIIAENMAESIPVRERVRDLIRKSGRLVSTRGPGNCPNGLAREFSEYFDFSQPLSEIPPRRVLALNHGERTKVLRVRIEMPLQELARQIGDLYLSKEDLESALKAVPPMLKKEAKAQQDEGSKPAETQPFVPSTVSELIVASIYDSIHRLLLPPLAREARRELTNLAEEQALEARCSSLKAMLMQPGIDGRGVASIMPGYRQGCRVAVLSASGELLGSAVLYPHEPLSQTDEAKQKLTEMVKTHGLKAVAIADTTACRETETMVADLIQDGGLEIEYVIAPSGAASAYATSKIAKEELRGKEVALRAAISLGRRVQDPLAELVKVDPRTLGAPGGHYGVSQKRLRDALRRTVESCVNAVGVNVNTASVSLLRRVSGLNLSIARNIVQRRKEVSKFANREQLKEVPGISEQIYKQCGGFLRIADGNNPLDATRVHPEQYNIALKCLESMGLEPKDILDSSRHEEVAEKTESADVAELAELNQCDEELIKDVLSEFRHPFADPRNGRQGMICRKGLMKIEDLKAGDVVPGVVKKIVEFGVFVDIGVGEDGLIHISELSDGYVRSAFDAVNVGEVLKVRILRVDAERKRIALTRKKPPSRKRPSRPKRPPQATRRGDQSAPAADRSAAPKSPEAAAPQSQDASESGPKQRHYSRPQSTLGSDSRRVQKSLLRPMSKTDQTILKSKPTAERQQETRKRKEEEKRKKELGGVLNKLRFGSIERRGKQK